MNIQESWSLAEVFTEAVQQEGWASDKILCYAES